GDPCGAADGAAHRDQAVTTADGRVADPSAALGSRPLLIQHDTNRACTGPSRSKPRETSMSDKLTQHSSCDDRDDCFVPTSRRRFLRDSFVSMAGALIAVGVSRNVAFAMPLDFVEAHGRDGTKHTYGIPAADGAQIDKQNEVILVRWQN